MFHSMPISCYLKEKYKNMMGTSFKWGHTGLWSIRMGHLDSDAKRPKRISFDDQNHHSDPKDDSKIYILTLRDFF